jgi:hypothetical protein
MVKVASNRTNTLKKKLAEAAQNPVADMISLPFQNNANLGFGPNDDVRNVLNIQPVFPFQLSENWDLITRTIAPLIYQPEVVEGTGDEFGLGDINFTAFFSPKNPTKGIIWGVGYLGTFLGFSDYSIFSSKSFNPCSSTICRSLVTDSLAVEDAMFSLFDIPTALIPSFRVPPFA